RVVRASVLGEEPKGVVVGTTHPMRVDDLVRARCPEPQRVLGVADLPGTSAIDHRPLVQTEAAEMGWTRGDALLQCAHALDRGLLAREQVGVDVDPASGVVSISGPCGVRGL